MPLYLQNGPIRILGTGSYVPPQVLTNFDLEAKGLDTSDEWIVQRTGVRERRVAGPNTHTSDLALEASKKALDQAGLSEKDVDLIIVATVTPDTHCPSCANWLQAKLGARQAVAFDVTAACSGFVFGLDVACQYLRTKAANTVLVAAAEIITRTLDWTDRATCILWGDGAGAAVLGRDPGGHQLLSTRLHSDGSSGKDLLLPGGGSWTTPISHESVDKGLHYLAMHNAAASFKVAVRHFMDAIREGAADAGLSPGELDWIIPHQANLRMFQFMAESMGIPMERFYMTVERYGNISSASCAIALDEAARDGSLQQGQNVCIPVFGGGLTWGSAMICW